MKLCVITPGSEVALLNAPGLLGLVRGHVTRCVICPNGRVFYDVVHWVDGERVEEPMEAFEIESIDSAAILEVEADE